MGGRSARKKKKEDASFLTPFSNLTSILLFFLTLFPTGEFAKSRQLSAENKLVFALRNISVVAMKKKLLL